MRIETMFGEPKDSLQQLSLRITRMLVDDKGAI